MSFLETVAVIFIVFLGYFASTGQAACVQMGDRTFGKCRAEIYTPDKVEQSK